MGRRPDASRARPLRARAADGPSILNHVRVPLLLSALAFVVWFPLILGLSAAEFERTTGLAYPAYLTRWVALTGGLFLVSALAYALRVRWMRRYGD